jgi:hypothetical protein
MQLLLKMRTYRTIALWVPLGLSADILASLDGGNSGHLL